MSCFSTLYLRGWEAVRGGSEGRENDRIKRRGGVNV
jgi:hypothetical protein